MTLEELKTWVDSKKKEGKTIVFTNGCFDLIHLGHLQYLMEAKKLGDHLIVGINSDASVKRIKSQDRPIKGEKTRLALIENLKMVDQAILFEEDTPLQLIKTFMPDVLVKGGDWRIDQIVGSELVLSNGGMVKSLGFLEGHSSSKIIEKIKKS